MTRYVEMGGVHDSVSLELHPHSIHTWAREYQTELHLRAAVGDEWMRMHHVDQVVAGDEHVPPGAEILLEAMGQTYARSVEGFGDLAPCACAGSASAVRGAGSVSLHAQAAPIMTKIAYRRTMRIDQF